MTSDSCRHCSIAARSHLCPVLAEHPTLPVAWWVAAGARSSTPDPHARAAPPRYPRWLCRRDTSDRDPRSAWFDREALGDADTASGSAGRCCHGPILPGESRLRLVLPPPRWSSGVTNSCAIVWRKASSGTASKPTSAGIAARIARAAPALPPATSARSSPVRWQKEWRAGSAAGSSRGRAIWLRGGDMTGGGSSPAAGESRPRGPARRTPARPPRSASRCRDRPRA